MQRCRRSDRELSRSPLLVTALALLLSTSCEEARPLPRNLILISIDTLRADHLGSYGHERPTSPALDELAAEGVLFEDAFSTSAWTLPSHASMFTGRYPSRHGVRTREHSLSGDVPTLATILAARGFATAGFVSGHFLISLYGVDQGFEHYEFVHSAGPRVGVAARITRAAQQWLESRRRQRSFLFLHFIDVHSDYVSQERYERLFVREPGRIDGSTRQHAAARGSQSRREAHRRGGRGSSGATLRRRNPPAR